MVGFLSDDLFDAPQEVVDFRFDERTVAVFADMIHRSIPAYAGLLQMVAAIGRDVLRDGDLVYDLGCSLGGVSLALRRFVSVDFSIHAVDLSEAMVRRLRDYLRDYQIHGIEVHQGDVVDFPLHACRFVVLNFVLQFIDRERRLSVLERCYQALQEGGVLLVAEKTQAEARLQIWHERFKAVQGYSELAIAQKRESLENVMRVDEAQEIESRLYAAGFKEVLPFYQGFAFRAWAAVK